MVQVGQVLQVAAQMPGGTVSTGAQVVLLAQVVQVAQVAW